MGRNASASGRWPPMHRLQAFIGTLALGLLQSSSCW
jgi:hypothetical protein